MLFVVTQNSLLQTSSQIILQYSLKLTQSLTNKLNIHISGIFYIMLSLFYTLKVFFVYYCNLQTSESSCEGVSCQKAKYQCLCWHFKQNFIIFFYLQRKMKKNGSQRQGEVKNSKKESNKISFLLQPKALQCFISERVESSTMKSIKGRNSKQETLKQTQQLCPKKINFQLMRSKASSFIEPGPGIFNNQILLMKYGQEDVYTDSIKGEGSKRSKTPSPQHNQGDQYDVVGECVRVITEQTNCTSNPISARQRQTPSTNFYMLNYQDMGYLEQTFMAENLRRNKRAISLQESRQNQIDVEKIEMDGRCTIMVRNIPIKYTQQMLIELFSRDQKIQKFDFFYLPIDPKNNCNVGYAFLNFLHPKFIKDFYLKFNGKKWEKFNSKKIIHVCYARIQGTAQLACHFENSKVLQKDKKLRPIGLNQTDYAHLSSLVEKQKTKI